MRYIETKIQKKNVNILGCEQQQGCSVVDGCGDSAPSCRTLETTGSAGSGGDSGTGSVQTQGQTQSSTHVTSAPVVQQLQQPSSISACVASCCAESAKKVDCIFNMKLKLRIIDETK